MPDRILFACTLNAIRSPMAEGILQHLAADSLDVSSAGVHAETVDPFSVAVLEANGIDISNHISRTFEELPRTDPFAQIIALSGQAYELAKALPVSFSGTVHFWPMEVPADVSGNREQQIMAYAKLRDALTEKIKQHFRL